LRRFVAGEFDDEDSETSVGKGSVTSQSGSPTGMATTEP